MSAFDPKGDIDPVLAALAPNLLLEPGIDCLNEASDLLDASPDVRLGDGTGGNDVRHRTAQ
jgi:hypothetical protein